MAHERRYDPREVARILERAADDAEVGGPRPTVAAEGGATLAELQAVAAEVGIPAESVVRSVAALDVGAEPVEVRRVLGIPLAVGRTVRLARPLTEAEWLRLVALARETFDATGVVEEHPGGLREWRDGPLHLTLEPTAEGARLRLRTRRAGAEAYPLASGAMAGMAVVVALAGVVKGDVTSTLAGPAALGLMGSAAWASGLVSLRGWAARRTAQFEALAAAAAAMAVEPPRD